MDCGSSSHGILQARILEWVAIPFSRDLPDPGIELGSPASQVSCLTSKPPRKPAKAHKAATCSPRTIWLLEGNTATCSTLQAWQFRGHLRSSLVAKLRFHSSHPHNTLRREPQLQRHKLSKINTWSHLMAPPVGALRQWSTCEKLLLSWSWTDEFVQTSRMIWILTEWMFVQCKNSGRIPRTTKFTISFLGTISLLSSTNDKLK